MIILHIIDILLFGLCALSAWYFLFQFIPKFGKQIALCMLHSVRDDYYREVGKDPNATDSLIIEDMEFTLTALIYAIREAPSRDTVPRVAQLIWSRLRIRRHSPADSSDWRSERYRFEFYRAQESPHTWEALDREMKLFERRWLPLSIFVFSCHPIMIMVVIALIPVLIVAFAWEFIARFGHIARNNSGVSLDRPSDFVVPIEDGFRALRGLQNKAA